ncbi:MAG: histidine kinase, partial [Bacteroidota bacterium]
MAGTPETADITDQISLPRLEEEALLEEQFLATKWLRGIACACGFITLIVGAVALWGRLSGMYFLASWGQDYKVIVPAMALSSVLLGAALVAITLPRHIPYRAIHVLGYVIALIAGLRLLEFAVGADWGASDLFLSHTLLPAAPDTLPAALPTAIGVFMAGVWASLQPRRVARTLLFILAGGTTVIGFAFVLGYVYGKPLLYGPHLIPIAVPMAVDLSLTGIGMVLVTAAQEAALRRLTLVRLRDGAARLANLSGQLEAIVTSIPDGITVYDNVGHLIRVNEAVMHLLGYTPQFMGMTLEQRLQTVTAHDANNVPIRAEETPMARALRGEVITGYVMRMVGLKENPPWLMVSAAPLRSHGSIYGAVLVYTDITRLRQIESELLSYQNDLQELVAERTAALETNQQRLRALAAELAISEQRERQRLAGVIHDELSQSLGVLKLQLSMLRASTDPDEIAKQATGAIAMIDDAIRQTRTLMMELSPPALRQGGLAEALRWWAQQVQEKQGLEVVTNINCDLERFDEVLETTVFQAVKELMHNTVKHARARRIDLTVSCADGSLDVEVADDGVGFDPQSVSYTAAGGFGLYGLRERLAYLGGELGIS